MSDDGLYQAMVRRLETILPKVSVWGCPPSEQDSPPYIIIQQTRLERAPLPHLTGRRTVTVDIISRYRGNAELLEMTQKISAGLEGDVLFLEKEACAFLKLEETSSTLEKDQITRRAQLIFSALLRFET